VTMSLAIPAWANSRPVAVDDSASAHHSETITIPVLTNDYDPDGDPIHISKFEVTSRFGANVKLGADGASLDYTAPERCNQTDSFRYQIADPSGATATAKVFVGIELYDMPCVYVTLDRPVVNENDGKAVIRETPIRHSACAPFHVVDGTATYPSDYGNAVAFLSCPAGHRRGRIVIPIKNDNKAEDTEVFYVVIEGLVFNLDSNVLTITIEDND